MDNDLYDDTFYRWWKPTCTGRCLSHTSWSRTYTSQRGRPRGSRGTGCRRCSGQPWSRRYWQRLNVKKIYFSIRLSKSIFSSLTQTTDSEWWGTGPAGLPPGGHALGLGVASPVVPSAGGALPILELDDLENAEDWKGRIGYWLIQLSNNLEKIIKKRELTFSFSVIYGHTISCLFHILCNWGFFSFDNASAPRLWASHQEQVYECSGHLNKNKIKFGAFTVLSG